MWPEVHRIGGLNFTLYDVMRGVAIVCSLGLCLVLNYRQGISVRQTLLVAAICVPLAIGAARLLNAIEYGATWENLGAEFMRNSGSSIYGALIACVFSVLAGARIMHLPALRFLDAGAPAVAVGEALSRVGCFCAGCCYGETWNGPWSVVFPGESFAAADQRRRGLLDGTMTNSLPVHPVQLYGVILMALAAWVLIRRFLRPHREGEVFFLLLMSYGVYRFAIAPFRVEVLTSMKVLSLIFVAAGVLGLLWRGRSKPAS